MNDENEHVIPAANIGGIDLIALAQIDPGAAREIKRLNALMNCGEETKEEFRTLCQLLFDAGAIVDAEYLLRRNLEFYEGEALYVQLFGNTKSQEFAAAIEAFKSQFTIELALVRRIAFLVSRFCSTGGRPRSDHFSLLARPCEIKFGYIERQKIEADVTLISPSREVFNAAECMLLFFINGVWQPQE